MPSSDSNADTSSSKYRVQIGKGKGIVIGDHNVVNMTAPSELQVDPGSQPAKKIWKRRIQIIIAVVSVIVVIGASSVVRAWWISTHSPAPPTQTLTTFCNDMTLQDHQAEPNIAAAKLLFTAHGWQQFQPSNGYTKCTDDSVTILPDKTTQGHLTVITAQENRTYGIDVSFQLEGNSWKIDSWASRQFSADASLQWYLDSSPLVAREVMMIALSE